MHFFVFHEPERVEQGHERNALVSGAISIFLEAAVWIVGVGVPALYVFIAPRAYTGRYYHVDAVTVRLRLRLQEEQRALGVCICKFICKCIWKCVYIYIYIYICICIYICRVIYIYQPCPCLLTTFTYTFTYTHLYAACFIPMNTPCHQQRGVLDIPRTALDHVHGIAVGVTAESAVLKHCPLAALFKLLKRGQDLVAIRALDCVLGVPSSSLGLPPGHSFDTYWVKVRVCHPGGRSLAAGACLAVALQPRRAHRGTPKRLGTGGEARYRAVRVAQQRQGEKSPCVHAPANKRNVFAGVAFASLLPLAWQAPKHSRKDGKNTAVLLQRAVVLLSPLQQYGLYPGSEAQVVLVVFCSTSCW
jgi:hypothetical protein